MAALATHPVPTTLTSGLTNFMMSYITSPDSTCPPGELIKIVIGSSLSADKANSFSAVDLATFSFICPKIEIERDLKSFSSKKLFAELGLAAFSSFIINPSLKLSNYSENLEVKLISTFLIDSFFYRAVPLCSRSFIKVKR